MPPSPLLPATGGVLFDDRYRPLKRLGGGNFGEVWKAEDTTTGRIVALKLVDPASTTPDMAWQEATRLTSLESPHLVRVHGAAMAVDVPYIDMALAERGSLAAAVQPLGAHPAQAAQWAQQVARGLQLCHARQLVHRDVKPENVLLSSVGNALLGDFGVSAVMASDGTVDEHGDIEIRAPEAFGGRCSAIADVYSLGATLFYLLCGRYPHQASDHTTLGEFATAVQGGAPNIRDLAPHVSRGLGAVVNRALATDPVDRYRTAADMDQALSRVRAPSRTVNRVPPHTPHGSCWDLSAPVRGSGKAMHVCVAPEGAGIFSIDLFYVGSGNRVRGHCASVHERRLATSLRALFQDCS